METRISEIADGIFRLSTYVPDVAPPAGFTFNQFLVLGDEPLMFHTGLRKMFPLNRDALRRIIAPEKLRWIAFGHYEADECGAMNEWLAIAPNAEVAHGQTGVYVSLNDMADRAPAVLHQTLIGAGALVIGAAMAWGASEIPSQAGYAGVGPNFLPWVVSVVLMVCGAWLVYEARTGGWRTMEPAPGAERGDWTSLAWVVAGVVANAALITTVGFVIGCTLCYVLAVRGFRIAKGPLGRATWLADIGTGVALAPNCWW